MFEQQKEIEFGKIKKLGDESYCFIVSDDSSGEIFANARQLEKAGFTEIIHDKKVSYSVRKNEEGKLSAFNIKILD